MRILILQANLKLEVVHMYLHTLSQIEHINIIDLLDLGFLPRIYTVNGHAFILQSYFANYFILS